MKARVERIWCGRASIVSITEAGRAAHRRAVGPHLRAAQRWFAEALDDAQLRELDDVLGTLEQHAARIARAADTDEIENRNAK